MTDAEKPKLTPANENPWYCLMTLHGEPDESIEGRRIASLNRASWNRLWAGGLDNNARKYVLLCGINADEIVPYNKSEMISVVELFKKRCKNKFNIPNINCGTILLEYLVFPSYVYINNYLFTRPIAFYCSSFKFKVQLNGCVFLKNTHFVDVTFALLSELKGCFFSDEISFMNSHILGSCHFNRTAFLRNVPDFRGTKMHEATEFHGVKWPDPPSDRAKAQAQVYAYERLKQEMERLKKHEDELFFFAKELRARQELPNSPFGARLLNYFYDLFSGYGLRMDRQLYWLIGLFLLGADIFVVWPTTNGQPLDWLQAFGLSFANIFSFLPLRKELVSPDVSGNLHWFSSAFSGAQMIFGALLLFLLGLALRNRFRMK